ncbi:glycosyltransferase family 2 protein [Qingshengfaniella alkalisoli]|uniref:Glycosyltransferase n=1 Tax=Qingshengfaniella alkalisoli TaxID=2599296 RepID=A0A5B8J4B5_9RHOB|nr:glycosyltransferase [Qingshengfaniella alkalisoli]QDY69110.1 glycosyltransferase [Qingshengfaniella alkalisoli]
MANIELLQISGASANTNAWITRPRLGQVLQGLGLITQDQIKTCVARQSTQEARFGDLLCEEAGLNEVAIMRALEIQWQTSEVQLDRAPPDKRMIDVLGVEHCLQRGYIPWRCVGARTVIAAVFPDHADQDRALLEQHFGPISIGVTTGKSMQAALAELYGTPMQNRAALKVQDNLSCRTWRSERFRRILKLSFIATAITFYYHPAIAFIFFTFAALIALLVQNGLKFAAALAMTRRTPSRPTENVVPIHQPKLPTVSILVPLFRESQIAGTLINNLSKLTYPAALLDVCLVVEADDQVTRTAISKSDLPSWIRVVTVPCGLIRTKPKAMNYALEFCRGNIIGIYDAEDSPQPDQIDKVVAQFAQADPDVACIQGRLQFFNARENWMSRCFAIDYASWFGMVLPGIAKLGLAVPLGGTTLFFRREILQELGGWDAHNVTEDADLGIRLARAGYRTELCDTATDEEANCRAWPWVRQRSRWIKGYAMTYATHMRRPLLLWRELGAKGFIGFQIMFLGSIAQALLAPMIWSWWLLLLGLPHPASTLISPEMVRALGFSMIAVELLNITISGVALWRTGQRGLIPWLPTFNFYNMLATIAACKAMIEMAYRPFFWDKTSHGHSAALSKKRIAA